MKSRPRLSLLIPTRGRPGPLRRLLDSLAQHTRHPQQLEIVLALDADDHASSLITHPTLPIRQVVGPPGRTMGQLNQDACQAASGDFFMLLNDDVLVRTPGWDELIHEWLRGFPDGVVLLHVNDTLMREHLCTFPLVSRTFVEIAGGLCPPDYRRYRIDDHLEEIFTLLALLGHRRIVHLPEVVFEHLNAVHFPQGHREYHSDPQVLALDAPTFERLLPFRKEIALRLAEHIERYQQQQRRQMLQRTLQALPSCVERSPKRLRIESISAPGRNTSVTVVVSTSNRRSRECRRCLATLEAHTRGHQVLLLEDPLQPFPSPRQLNHCLKVETDLVAFLTDRVLVEPGWLDALRAEMTSEVAMATPVLRQGNQHEQWHGIRFLPPPSLPGLYEPVSTPLSGPTAILSCCQPLFLLDRMRAEHLCFEEMYTRYFFVLDFGLRLRERGLQVVCTPRAQLSLQGNDALSPQFRQEDEVLERDRQLFVRHWIDTGKLLAIQTKLRPLSVRKVDFPIPSSTPLPPSLATRLVRCYQQRGVRGLTVAAGRHLARLLTPWPRDEKVH